MKFARIGQPGHERPIVITDDDAAYDLTSLTADIDGAFLAADGIARTRAALTASDLAPISTDDERIAAPVARPNMVMCVGLNYRAHAAETGAPIPTEPILFSKATRCVIGPDDTVLIPRASTHTDYEVELAIIIGTEAHYLTSPEAAMRHIAGYAISNDVSEREFQKDRGGQWVKGKSCDTFNPLGPWLVPADELNGNDLDLTLWVNGELRQSSNTSDMIFDIGHLVWYISQFMVLEPGDVVNTGTPQGVAMGMPGEPYLRKGDQLRLAIAGLGEQHQTVGQA